MVTSQPGRVTDGARTLSVHRGLGMENGQAGVGRDSFIMAKYSFIMAGDRFTMTEDPFIAFA